jgi:glycosyltransferase involved in cell wall biosynthesis
MIIGFDAKRALNNPTGLGNHARILINALSRDFAENDYILFTPKVKDEFFDELNGKFQMLLPEKRFEKIFHPIWRSFGVKKQLYRSRADIYHGLSNELPFEIQHYPSRNVVTIHDLIFLKHKEQYPYVDRRFYELKTRYAARNADKIIAVSQETKRDLMEFYKVPESKIAVIYPSVDPLFYAQDLPSATPGEIPAAKMPKYILNVGSFFPRKNQKRLIEAYSLISEKIEEELWLVGSSGSMMESIRNLIADKKFERRVKILSDVKNADLPAIYRQATAFVFPSLFEGFGAPVLEALFSRTPVIATGYGAIAEVAGKDAVFVNPLSAEDMAEKILAVINNASFSRTLTEKGYEHALTMTDVIFARQVMNIYKDA